jgi:AraC-like DNA-binding protein
MGVQPASPPPTKLSYQTNDVRALLDGLARLGYDADAIRTGAGISLEVLDDPDLRVPCEAFGRMFEIAARMRRIPNVMLRLAECTPIGAFPLIDYLVVTSDTVGAGLQQLGRYFRLIGNGIEFVSYTDEDPIRVVLEGEVPPAKEFNVALGVIHMRTETEGRFAPVVASLGHAVDDVEDYARALRCPVQARAGWSGWLIAPDMWRLPLRRRDPILRGVLERHANAIVSTIPTVEGIVQDVRRVLASRIAGGDAGIEAVARALATAPRTLQRRLAAAGSSFQSLVELTRREAAERYLAASALSIAEIGYLLGYSEAAAFHRAFKRWNGRTPHTFRAHAAATRPIAR